MKVRCTKDRIEDLPNHIRKWIKPRFTNADDDQLLHFVKNEEYVVYGIIFWDNRPFYYLCDGPDESYPVPRYAGFFEVIDDRFSSGWKLVHHAFDDGNCKTALLYKKWADNLAFYENLLEEEDEEMALFKQYKEEMDKEAN